jgi:phenylpropionate dioxygenase-like ring-hydroxylating dioxygenase large terminal subunit
MRSDTSKRMPLEPQAKVRVKAKSTTRAAPNGKAKRPLRPVPFAITDLERIPPQRYYDQEFYDLECKYLWPHVWQMACREEEIPQVGDWVQYWNVGQSVIVVRTEDGIKAFNNACRHRGAELATGHGSCKAKGFICPYHGWRYSMDGENTFVYAEHVFSEEALEKDQLNLVPVRVELWGGCVFINFDDDARPLMECIQPFATPLEPRAVEKLKIEAWYLTELPVNWKLAMEAFMEGYHTMRSHPELYLTLPGGLTGYDTSPPRRFGTPQEFIEAFINFMKTLGNGIGGMVRAHDWEIAEAIKDEVELPDDMAEVPGAFFRILQDEITKRRRAQGVPMPDLNSLPPVESDYFCFPHYFWLPTFANMLCYRIRPLGPEKCLFELMSLILYPEDEVRPRPVAPEPVPIGDPRIPLIPTQDYSNLPRQQRGLHTNGFEYMRLSKEKEGTISRYHQVIDGFIAGLDNVELARGMAIACAPLDSPVVDVGFRRDDQD